MKKKAFAVLYLVITVVVATAAVAVAVRDQRAWPSDGAGYDSLMEKGLRSWDGLKEISGAANRVLQPDVIFEDGEAVVRTEDDFLIPYHVVTGFDMDQAIEGIKALKEFCTEYDIPLFYVAFPSKATYFDGSAADYGVLSDEKEIRALFLDRIRELEIPLLDMAGVFRNRGFRPEDVFYKTDHHWKTRMGLIAAGEIAEFLQAGTKAKLHPELLDEGLFHATTYEKIWLGETGRKVSSIWAGTLDDYVLYEPDYDTAFEYYVPSAKISTEGDFSAFIDYERLSGNPDLYNDSLHYVYMKDAKTVTHFRNKNLSGANILLIKDSYSVPVAPFLAAATGELTWWDMRKNNETVFAYIDKHRFDAVVIAYTDFWRNEMYDFR